MNASLQGTRLLVLPEHHGLRLDQFLAASTALSRRAARSLIGAGEVARNRQPTRVLGRQVSFGDAVDVLRPPAELGVPARPELPGLPILYEDRWLLAVAKPAGMLSQPAAEPSPDLALDQLALLTLALRDGGRSYLELVHRLDRLTSGVTLFAHNPQAHGPLARAWASGAVERRYLAVVEGVPTEASTVIDLAIGRDPDHGWRFRVDAAGRSARTELRRLAVLDDDLAVVECRLDTGRTHQVRVHLSAHGHPVLGDRLYGSRRAAAVPRPLLHAASLTLPHPRDGVPLTIVAPVPQDMAPYVAALRHTSPAL